MLKNARRVVTLLVLGVAFFCAPVQGKNSITWNKELDRVDAEIDNWDLKTLLDKVSKATGWQIYIEPQTVHTVSAKFKKLPPLEALSLMLGKLNFALIPQSNAPPKLCVFRTSLGEATQLFSMIDEDDNIVEDELILALKPGSKLSIEELAKRFGAKVTGKIDDLNAYKLEFDGDEAASLARDQLEKDPNVASVENNVIIDAPPRPESVLMSSSLPFSLNPSLGDAGNQIIVALIDTPFQNLGGRMQDFMLPPISTAGEAKTSATVPTHGTSMAETLLRGLYITTPDNSSSPVRILPIDVYGNRANTTTFDVANGISTAIKNGATVVNLSLGSSGNSRLLQTVIQNGSAQGILFVSAAGNEPVATATYPAAYPEVLAVTAGTRNGTIAPYANRGAFVDVVAPGSSIVQFGNRSYIISGTSSASAIVAGMAAGMRSGGRSATQTASDLRRTLPIKR